MHLAAIAISLAKFGSAHWFFTSRSIAEFPSMRPPGWGFDLRVVYVIWITLVVVLYPLCRWFAGVKARAGYSWLSYF
jgi:phosphotransferase system  glucose/maltose/N-acetylglucosamine-specific IIC component